MPREKTLYKFRCKELLCGNYPQGQVDKTLPEETWLKSSGHH